MKNRKITAWLLVIAMIVTMLPLASMSVSANDELPAYSFDGTWAGTVTSLKQAVDASLTSLISAKFGDNAFIPYEPTSGNAATQNTTSMNTKADAIVKKLVEDVIKADKRFAGITVAVARDSGDFKVTLSLTGQTATAFASNISATVVKLESVSEALVRAKADIEAKTRAQVEIPAITQKGGDEAEDAWLLAQANSFTESYVTVAWKTITVKDNTPGAADNATITSNVFAGGKAVFNIAILGSGQTMANPMPAAIVNKAEANMNFSMRDRGIDTGIEIIDIPAVLDTANSGKGADEIDGDVFIDLTNERLYIAKYITNEDEMEEDDTLEPAYAPVFAIASFSIDGGTKWKNGMKSFPEITLGADDDEYGADEYYAYNISKLLNKGLTLMIADTTIDKSTKKPAKVDYVAEKAAGVDAEGNPTEKVDEVEASIVLKFAAIDARPKVTVKPVINYVLKRDNTGATSGNWVLTAKGGTTALTTLQIAETAGVKLVKGEALTWGTVESGGVAVYELLGASKAFRQQYVVRYPATKVGNKFTPATKEIRLTASSELAAPKLKYNAKRFTINTKANSIVNGKLIATKNIEVPAAMRNGGEFEIRLAATDKRPASAPALIKAGG